MGESARREKKTGFGVNPLANAVKGVVAADLDKMSAVERQSWLQKEQELMEEEAQAASKVDLLEIIRTAPEKFPLKACNWNVLMEMVEVPNKMGRFIKTKDQMRAEQLFVTCGRVLLAGPTCLTGETESKIPLWMVAEGIQEPADLVGKFFHIQRYTGNEVLYAPLPTKQLKYLTVSEFLGITTDPRYWVKDALPDELLKI